MVVGAFPVVKLGALLLRQISKPIANTVKEHAKNHKLFRTYICMPPAQFYNWCEIKAKMWILNLGKPVNIPVLNEAMAIELGANLVGEAIVYFIAAAILVNEYNRGVKNEAIKENRRLEEKHELESQIHDMFFRIEQQDAQIRELTRKVFKIDLPKFDYEMAEHRKPPKPSSDEPPPKHPNKPDIIRQPDNVQPPKENQQSNKKNLVLNAAETMQQDITGYGNYMYQDNGLLNNAIRYIHYDVYRAPISVK